MIELGSGENALMMHFCSAVFFIHKSLELELGGTCSGKW